GDEVTLETLSRLHQSFITPFDPEDIHQLAGQLDDVLDAFDGLVQRCRIYGLVRPAEPMRRLTALLQTAAEACGQALASLEKNGDAASLQRLKRAEVESDAW